MWEYKKMILPSKTIKPVDSLFCISSYIIEEMGTKELAVDEIHKKLMVSYPKAVSIETLLLCLNYLYIIGKLENNNEVIKIKF